ncbi:NAD-dependent epimerase/dehydratase family protein [Vogesella sp. LYT5W]|uniref:NAD-dependent epimerase/dehydratase family protein n=1 Tax=Vogesella margarita TaxID=2984199 RepID=A0ABT5IQ29_9NEIS|nr:NAD-dependent epimerase/dehydratase family protein [Vogesella margarita]MDC7714632.1 NAD-dependent epimerase/dehydratase family protein [Vogesella margarita]
MRKIILTGATGYIGRKLLYRLLERGHSVSVVVREKSPRLSSLPADTEKIFYDGTFNSLLDGMKDKESGLVIHVASLFLTQHKPEDIGNLIDSNIKFPCYLLEAMHTCGLTEIINTGTSWQHYENSDYNPVNLYAASKQAFVDMLKFYQEAHHFKALTLELFDTFGPDDERKKLFHFLQDAAETGKTLKISPGQQLLDIVYIDDVLNAYEIAIKQSGKLTGTFTVASGQLHNLQEIVAIYSKISQKKLNIEFSALPYRLREVMKPWECHRNLPNWTCEFSLEEGIKKILCQGMKSH